MPPTLKENKDINPPSPYTIPGLTDGKYADMCTITHQTSLKKDAGNSVIIIEMGQGQPILMPSANFSLTVMW